MQGTYAGDTNYESSTSPSVTVTASKVASVTTLTVTPATLTTGITETLTATVAPVTAVTGTAYSLTGSVNFYDGTVLLGTVPVGSDTAVLTGITLSASSNHSLTAVYSGDATYSASTSTAVVLASTLLPVTVTLTESTQILSPGQAVTLNAVVTPVNTPAATVEQHPSGYVLFYAGNVLVGTQAPVLESTGYSSVASTFVSSLAAGTYTITAVYSGDPTYAPATSNTLTLQVEDFGLTCSATNITMVQGTTQAVPCTVSSLGGLTGSIQVVCEEQNPPTLGAITCTFDPSIVNNTGTTTLTVVTTAGQHLREPSRKHASSAPRSSTLANSRRRYRDSLCRTIALTHRQARPPATPRQAAPIGSSADRDGGGRSGLQQHHHPDHQHRHPARRTHPQTHRRSRSQHRHRKPLRLPHGKRDALSQECSTWNIPGRPNQIKPPREP